MGRLLLHTPRSRWRRRLRRGGPSPLAGRTVLVTGASSGIGEATAYAAARRGAVVLLVARRAEELARVQAAIEAAGGTAAAYPCDLTDGDAVDSLVARVLAEHGAVDYLVNNAGRSIRRSLELSYDRFHDVERTMAVNFFAPVRLTLGLLPAMREQGFGHVVNVLSWGVQLKAPKFTAYLASKTALDTWSRIAGRETYGDGVTFTNIRFGMVRTSMVVPTGNFEDRRVITPEQAAERVVRALEDRPVTVDTVIGTVGELVGLLAPRASDALVHRLHRRSPDSAAARGRSLDLPPSVRRLIAPMTPATTTRVRSRPVGSRRPSCAATYPPTGEPAASSATTCQSRSATNTAGQRQEALRAAVLRVVDFLVVVFLAAVFFVAAVFFAGAFFAGAFFAAVLRLAVFFAGLSSASSLSSEASRAASAGDSPRAVFAASTERCSAASRSTTSPEVLVEVGVRLTSPPSTLALTRASTAPA